MIAKEEAQQAVAAMRQEITAIDEEVIHDVVGVAQAVADLRMALDEVEACLDRRDFEKAAACGYDSVSPGFVFAQRTLGGLHERCMDKARIVQQLAGTLDCAYEDALPHVDAIMHSAQPRGPKR